MTNLQRTPPPGLSVRHVVVDDVDAVAALVAAATLADTGEVDFGTDSLKKDWDNPDLVLEKDTWLVFLESDDQLVVGYAQIIALSGCQRFESMGLVHPNHRGRGIGWYLCDLLELRAAEFVAQAPTNGAIILHNCVASSDRAGQQLLEERGFVLRRHLWRMDLTLTDDLQSPDLIPGVTVRRAHIGRDERAIHRTVQDAFAEHWGFVRRGFDEWAAHNIGGDASDGRFWWVAESKEDVVGAVLGSVVDGAPWVQTVGVCKGWRRRGIGEALLRHCFLEFHRCGFEQVQLAVDSADKNGATALYERVGMRVGIQWDSYEKLLR